MELRTKYFGTVPYEEEDRLFFPAGLIGFEEERHFLLLPFAGSDGAMLCLQSVSTPALAFIVMDPFALCGGYDPRLPAEELALLGAERSGELCFYVLAVVKKPVTDSTVNLRCPVVIHPGTLVARQVFLETEGYGMRHPLSEFGRGEDGRTC